MSKHLLIFAINLSFATMMQGQDLNKPVFYFKNDANGYHEIASRDSADFLRIILPPDPNDSLFNIKEFYKDGKIKLIGRSEPSKTDIYKTGQILLSGTCITYFPNGKKDSIANYIHGIMEGLEYMYYSNGGLYCVKKNAAQGYRTYLFTKYMDCYDINEIQICKNGHGHWLIYDSFRRLQSQGPVREGLKDGKWWGTTLREDSIKYLFNYASGILVSGIGYDRNGKAYPLKGVRESPYYKNDISGEAELVKSCLQPPLGKNRKQPFGENVIISCIIEKDGSLSYPEISGIEDITVVANAKKALLKSAKWTPGKYFGMPIKTKLTMALKDPKENKGTFSVNIDKETIEYINN